VRPGGRHAALLLIVVLTGTGCVRASKTSASSISFAGKVNRRGTVTVTHAPDQPTLLEMDLSNYAFTPTVVKVKAGTDLTLQLRNTGTVAHSFTITALHVDFVVLPGQGVNQPMKGFTAGQIHFVCRFHRTRGMQGGFLVNP
jgi:plastocyanin